MTDHVLTAPADLCAQMTLAEKCAMVVGTDMWTVLGCERLGIPSWTVSDGPVGVRGRLAAPGLVVPCSTALAATWDPTVVEEVGAAMGQECLDKQIDLLLAPTTNIQRSPRSGRHFECFSEDPELSARMAVAYIDGVQRVGVGACVKHFAANDQETDRFEVDAQVDERTLRELHYPPFEAAVVDAGVRSVMGAYNRLNGDPCCAHPRLLLDVLKGEWGFDGIVVSDWSALKSTVAPARAGLDVEMPGPGRWWGAGQLEAAVVAGDVDEADLDDKVRRIVSFLAWRGRLGEPPQPGGPVERPLDRAEHRAVARRAATESIVLLRNSRGVLPLRGAARVALIGPGAADTCLLGGGSAMLEPHRRTDVLSSLRARLGDDQVTSALGVRLRRRPPSLVADGIVAELYAGPEPTGAPFAAVEVPGARNLWARGVGPWPSDVEVLSVRLRATVVAAASGPHRALAAGIGAARLLVDGVVVADNGDGAHPAGLGLHGTVGEVHLEAGQRYVLELEHRPKRTTELVLVDLGLEPMPPPEEALVAEAVAAAAAADVAVVVVGTNDEWESEGADRDDLRLPNDQDELVRAVLAANPDTVVVVNSGAPVLLPWLEEVPAALLAWYPGQEGGEAIADVLLGDADPGGRMPTTWAWREDDTPTFGTFPARDGADRYAEGVFVGYRWFDDTGRAPMLAFGHGGSYTDVEWGPATVRGSGTQLSVEVPLTNVGLRAGSEVVQVYVGPVDPVVRRPAKELAGFAKVRLAPGQHAVASVRLRARAFARWDAADGAWVEDPGAYRISVAASALDVREVIEVHIDG